MTLWNQFKARTGKNVSSAPIERSLLLLGGSPFEHAQLINRLKESANNEGRNLSYVRESQISPIGFHFVEFRDEEHVVTGIVNVHTIADSCIHRAEDLISKFASNKNTVVIILVDSNKLLNQILDNNDALALDTLPHWMYILSKVFGSRTPKAQSRSLDKGAESQHKLVARNASNERTFWLELRVITVVFSAEILDYMTNTKVLVHNKTIDTLQQTLRLISMYHGCSLYYWNSLSSCEILQGHILHMMGIHSPTACDSAVFESLSSIFIPYGWDSIDKIVTIDKTRDIQDLTTFWREKLVAPISQTGLILNSRIHSSILQDYRKFLQKRCQCKNSKP
ncbi:BA75_01065T0 [Komagataella pastoris]|uniref:BA75_01065T0 n=1 Tax=Komagataella pastoris TaxID=4922 RepID=A0A1B2J9Y3_PICPA|nr:BA75_01065T0 [Komagataella pastoris]